MKRIALLFASMLLVTAIPMQVLAVGDTSEKPGEIFAEEDQNPWEMDMTSDDLNTRYESLLQNLENNGFGEKANLQFPEFAGYSLDAVQLFQESYGELWKGLQLESPGLPSDFSANALLQQGMETRNTLFSDVKSTDLYQTVMSQMDVSGIWKKASGGLPSVGSLMSNSFQQDFLSKGQGEKQSNQDYLAGIQEGALDLFTKSGGLLSENNKNSFWGAVKDMKDILSSGNGSMEDVFDKMK